MNRIYFIEQFRIRGLFLVFATHFQLQVPDTACAKYMAVDPPYTLQRTMVPVRNALDMGVYF